MSGKTRREKISLTLRTGGKDGREIFHKNSRCFKEQEKINPQKEETVCF